MISRKYNRKVDIYTQIDVPDGFGGNTSADAFVTTAWAEVKQNSSFRDNTLGNYDIKKTYSFKVRTNPLITPESVNISIIYKGQRYIANDISYADELFREINIIANG